MKERLKKIGCILMAIVMTSSLWSPSFQSAIVYAEDGSNVTAEATQKEKQIAYEGATNTVESDKVSVTKTVAPTGQENIFDITLKVVTEETLENLDISPDAAVVLVMDTSGSMAWTMNGKTTSDKTKQRIYAAKTSAKTFIDSFADASADVEAVRKIGIVQFANRGSVVQGLTDVNTGRDTLKNAVDGLNANGGTNIEDGLQKAYEMLNASGVSATSRYILLLSDGTPTYHNEGNGVGGTGGSTGHDDHNRVYNGTNGIADQIRAAGTQIYSVYIGGADNRIDCTGRNCTLNETVVEWLKHFSTEVYNTTDAGKLAEIFKKISQIITIYADAWRVTDPMGDKIEYQNLVTQKDCASFDNVNNILKWELRSDTPEVRGSQKIYTLTYRVKLDNVSTEPAFVEGQEYLTNGDTVLDYFMKADIDSDDPQLKHINFNVPKVKGYLSDLTFKKTGADTNSALAGAVFTLTGDNGVEMTATSDAEGNVTFTNIPSGYDYTLIETQAPEGYEKSETSRGVNVSYDVVTVDGAITPADWVNTVPKTNITVEKKWDDANNQDGKRPDGIAIDLMKNGEKYTTVSLPKDGEWSATVEVPQYENGKLINWTANEAQVPGYEAPEYDYSKDGVITVTNARTPEKTSVTVNKVWNDNNNQDGKRPESITVQLMKGETAVGDPVTVTGENWTYTWNNLPKYENGQEITYTVAEVDVPEGYTSVIGTIDANGNITVTNSYTPELTQVSVEKVWEDANNQAGFRPGNIDVELYKNGEFYVKETIDVNEGWAHTWTNLPKYENGQVINWTVKEIGVPNWYTSETTGNMSDGFTITNTYEPTTVSVAGEKNWDDEGNQDGKRPTSITINLLANGVEVDEQVVTGTEWSWSFTNLPEYLNGQKVVYTITEDPVEDYTTTVDGYNVTNKYTPETLNITGSKTWNDNKDQDGVRPESIEIKLLADGVVKKTVTVTEEDGWAWSFEGLPKYRAEGIEIVYTIQETPVDGYTTTVDGANVTNTHTPEKIDINGSKTWADADNQDGKRPESIEIKLLADGVVKETVTVTEKDGWAWSFEDLDKYRDKGVEIVYTIEETPVDGYTTTVDGANVTNTHTPEKIDINGSKTWADADNQDGKRPESIEIKLLADGKVIDTVTVGADGNWTWNFEDLDKYANGVEIVYTIEETPVDGYTTTVDGANVTNTHTPEKIDINGSKTWADADNQDGKRPESIEIKLLANGKVIDTVTVGADDNWTWNFEDLDKYANGVEIVYTIEETPVDGYTTTVDGANVTNTHTPEKIDINGSKTWEDADNQDGVRPESITINLVVNGEIIDSQTVTEEDGWAWSFENLDKYKDGAVIEYVIEEEPVAGYETDVDGYDVTNTHTPATTELTVVKAWNDDDNRDGIRPASVTVQLKAGDNAYGDEVVLDKDNNWTHTYTNLPVNAAGEKIEWSVEEVTVPNGYTVSYSAIENDTITVTNTHEIATTAVGVEKVWVDDNDRDGIRPDDVTVQLMANGVVVEGKTATLNEANSWEAEFTNLPKNDKGAEITYTVVETPVEGYDTTYSEIVESVITVTNTHNPGTTSISVTKNWVDDENRDGMRPLSVTVELYANEEATGKTVELNAGNDWTAVFANLHVNEGGNPIAYTVQEADVPEGYKVSYGELTDGVITVTNTHEPELTSVTVNKAWNDDDNRDGIRPGSVTVELYADGEPTGKTATLSADDWTAEFTGLFVKEAGNDIVYTVVETSVDGYEAAYEPIENGVIEVTNTHEIERTEVTIEKIWDDFDNQDGIRPTEVVVELLKDGTVVDSKTLTFTDGWEYTWDNLPKNEDGVEIEWTVREVDPGFGYVPSIDEDSKDDFDITNARAPEQTEVNGSKTWNDADNQDGIRPESIVINLLADGEVIDTQTVSAEDNWAWSFTELDKYRDAGVEIVYTIEEEAVEGYEAVVDGNNVTNTHAPEQTEVNGSKTWNDADNQDGIRPESIVINLLADGEVVDTQTVTAEDNWAWSFTELDKYRDEGVEIVYTIEEEAVEGYTTIVDGADVINTHEVEKTSVTANKVWNDDNDRDGIRPNGVTVELYANGEATGKTAELNADNEWTAIFDDLDVNEAGKAIVYTVVEEAVEGYEAAYSAIENGAITVTNTHQTETTSVTVDKAWNDDSDRDGIRPNTVTVELYANGEATGKTAELNAENNWSASFDGLHVNEAGKSIVYTVVETVVDGYEAAYSAIENGAITVTNTHKTAETIVTVDKVWNDDDNRDGIRPNGVTVELYANGEATGKTAELNAENNWTAVFDGLHVNEAGKAVVYTVVEEAVEGYEATYSTIENGAITVTNTHKTAETSVTVDKVWNDDSDRDGIRPDGVTVELYANGEATGKTAELNAENNWTAVFDGLYVNEAGEAIAYTVVEEAVEGYEATYSAIENGAITVTNTHQTAETSVTVHKVWKDENDEDGIRPDGVTVELYANGKATGKTVELNAENDWTAVFDGLHVNEAGEAVVYTVVEEAVEGYEAAYSEMSDGVITIVNKHKVTPKIPETGDNSDMSLWLALLSASGAAMMFARRKRRAE